MTKLQDLEVYQVPAQFVQHFFTSYRPFSNNLVLLTVRTRTFIENYPHSTSADLCHAPELNFF